MPRRNGTGPQGQGPKTGEGRGKCSPARPSQGVKGSGRGAGRGQKAGRRGGKGLGKGAAQGRGNKG